MNPLSDKDIESELSYAYLHAVASAAGMACQVANRLNDNHGIDAQLTAWRDTSDGPEEIDIKVQLKATKRELSQSDTHLSFPLANVNQYDALRNDNNFVSRLLVVLLLPHNPAEWLRVTPEELVLKKCAYWVSLRGAPPTLNSHSHTIRIPKDQLFTSMALQNIANELFEGTFQRYSEGGTNGQS
jgi:hypothetical protein